MAQHATRQALRDMEQSLQAVLDDIEYVGQLDDPDPVVQDMVDGLFLDLRELVTFAHRTVLDVANA